MTGFLQLKDTNLGKDIKLLGIIFMLLNIEHIPHTFLDALVFDNVLIYTYIKKGILLVIGVMADKMITFVGYT